MNMLPARPFQTALARHEATAAAGAPIVPTHSGELPSGFAVSA
jgi:hypothetical protein